MTTQTRENRLPPAGVGWRLPRSTPSPEVLRYSSGSSSSRPSPGSASRKGKRLIRIWLNPASWISRKCSSLNRPRLGSLPNRVVADHVHATGPAGDSARKGSIAVVLACTRTASGSAAAVSGTNGPGRTAATASNATQHAQFICFSANGPAHLHHSTPSNLLYRADCRMWDRKAVLTSSFRVADLVHCYGESFAPGEPVPEMPLFYDPDWYINLPLDATYTAAYQGVPRRWKIVIEAVARIRHPSFWHGQGAVRTFPQGGLMIGKQIVSMRVIQRGIWAVWERPAGRFLGDRLILKNVHVAVNPFPGLRL